MSTMDSISLWCRHDEMDIKCLQGRNVVSVGCLFGGDHLCSYLSG